MKKTIKMLIIVLAIILVMVAIVLGIINLTSKDSKESSIDNYNSKTSNTENIVGKKRVYSYGIKNDKLYLNYDDGTSESIYNINTNREFNLKYYMYKEQKIYVIYNDDFTTKYVDVIDLLNNSTDKFKIDEMYSLNDNRDLNIYFWEKLNFYRYNLKTKKTSEEPVESIYNVGYSVNDRITGIKYNDKVYYKDETNLIILDTKTNKKQTVANFKYTNETNVSKLVAILDDNSYFYTDLEKVYFKGNIIYDASNKDTYIESIGLIDNNNLQITIHNRERKSFSESLYKFLNYDIKSGKTTSIDNGFENIFDIHSLNVYSNIEGVTEDNSNEEKTQAQINYSTIESNAICKKKLNDNLDNNIDEEKICELIDLSTTEFSDYKNKFINGDETSYDIDENKRQQYIKNAQYNFLALENIILLSDESTVNELTKYLDKEFPSKYNKLFACIYSGIINYYFEDEITGHSITEFKNTGSVWGFNELQTKINNNFIISYTFRRDTDGRKESFEAFNLIMYKDIENFDEFNTNYDKYKDGSNTFLNIHIYSSDYMYARDSLYNN